MKICHKKNPTSYVCSKYLTIAIFCIHIPLLCVDYLSTTVSSGTFRGDNVSTTNNIIFGKRNLISGRTYGIHSWHKSFVDKLHKETQLVGLNISKAFDMERHTALLIRIPSYSLSSQIRAWINSIPDRHSDWNHYCHCDDHNLIVLSMFVFFEAPPLSFEVSSKLVSSIQLYLKVRYTSNSFASGSTDQLK